MVDSKLQLEQSSNSSTLLLWVCYLLKLLLVPSLVLAELLIEENFVVSLCNNGYVGLKVILD